MSDSDQAGGRVSVFASARRVRPFAKYMHRAYVEPMDRLSNLLGALGVALADDQTATMAAASDLPLTDAACLNVVAHNNMCSLRFLSETLAISHPGTVRLVDRLVSAGLVERGAGPDRRTVGVHLTIDGRHRWILQRDSRGRRLDEVIAQLTAQERTAATTVVERLLSVLTSDEAGAERMCRFCDESACPQQRCPVTCAVST